MQGRGMAKELLRSLERYAANNGIPTLSCKIRLLVQEISNYINH
ncbi:hypothetical protein NSQ14_03720 [Caldifermentibacillus hisashii]